MSVATYVGSSTVAVCRAAASLRQQCPFPVGSAGDCLPPPWTLRRRLPSLFNGSTLTRLNPSLISARGFWQSIA